MSNGRGGSRGRGKTSSCKTHSSQIHIIQVAVKTHLVRTVVILMLMTTEKRVEEVMNHQDHHRILHGHVAPVFILGVAAVAVVEDQQELVFDHMMIGEYNRLEITYRVGF